VDSLSEIFVKWPVSVSDFLWCCNNAVNDLQMLPILIILFTFYLQFC